MLKGRVSELVHRRLPARAVVLGSATGALYASLQTEPPMAIAFTATGLPAMPNGIALTGPVPELAAGTDIEIGPGSLRWPAGALAWDATVVDRRVSVIGAQGWLLHRLDESRIEPSALAVGFDDAVGEGASPSELADAFTGRGGGLTPEGDDLLCAFIVTCTALGVPEVRTQPLLPADLDGRTTLLSATLLRCAAQGTAVDLFLDLFEANLRWQPTRLASLGHSTGRAYLAGAATALAMVERDRADGSMKGAFG